MTVGILAFGSIFEYPGEELKRVTEHRVDGVYTPFAVEFARSSKTRDGAPTLVPVSGAGASIPATVLILNGTVTTDCAADMLYRRESHKVDGSTYRDSGASWIGKLERFADLEVCLYTALPPNIEPLIPQHLAELAVMSAHAASGKERRDGISYLQEQKDRGIETPLMADYEAEVLRQTCTADLESAWVRVAGTS